MDNFTTFFTPIESQREIFRTLKHIIVDRLPDDHMYKKALLSWANESRIHRADVESDRDLSFVTHICNELDDHIRDGDVCGIRNNRVCVGHFDCKDLDVFIVDMQNYQTKLTESENINKLMFTQGVEKYLTK